MAAITAERIVPVELGLSVRLTVTSKQDEVTANDPRLYSALFMNSAITGTQFRCFTCKCPHPT